MKFSRKRPTPERRDDGRDPGRLAQRLVGQPLDGHAQEGRPQHAESRVGTKGELEEEHGEKAEKGAHHEEVAVGKVDHGQDAVDHGVAQGDQGIDAAELEGVQYLLEEVAHRSPACADESPSPHVSRLSWIRIGEVDELAVLDLEDHGALYRVGGAFPELHVAGDPLVLLDLREGVPHGLPVDLAGLVRLPAARRPKES